MAAALVTLVQAKAHLRITLPALDPGDLDIQLKLDQAEAIILDYLGTSTAATWLSPATAPGAVSAAILLFVAHLFEHRGDDQQADADLWQAIDRLLVRYRTSAIA